MSFKIKCLKHITGEHTEKYSVKNDMDHEIVLSKDCPFAGIKNINGCSTCHGQCVYSEKKKKLYRNYYRKTKHGSIIEENEYDKFMLNKELSYQIVKFETNPKTTMPWVYTERPSSWQTDCEVCKSKSLRKGILPECKQENKVLFDKTIFKNVCTYQKSSIRSYY